jgi:predicted aspartyl protease
MIFYYRPAVALAPETGEPTLIFRPEMPIRIFGPRGAGHYRALVDTGADNTILPKRIADDLGIVLSDGSGPQLRAFGGQSLKVVFGDVEIEIEDENERLRWPARVQFFEFSSTEEESLVLGHSGFLDYFVATFDGGSGNLTLIANEDLPTAD